MLVVTTYEALLKAVKSPSGAAAEPATIAAMMVIVGGLKMSASMKRIHLGGWSHRRWHASTEKCPESDNGVGKSTTKKCPANGKCVGACIGGGSLSVTGHEAVMIRPIWWPEDDRKLSNGELK